MLRVIARQPIPDTHDGLYEAGSIIVHYQIGVISAVALDEHQVPADRQPGNSHQKSESMAHTIHRS
jgi:hypothetical protein